MVRCLSCTGGAAQSSGGTALSYATSSYGTVGAVRQQANNNDTALRSSATLTAGDVVIVSFRHSAGVDGEACAYLVPTVNIAAGTTLYITRYARDEEPTLDAPVTNTINIESDLTRGAPLQLRFDTSLYANGLILLDDRRDTSTVTTADQVGRTPTGETWAAAANNTDTIMVYTASQRGMVPLHAVGFFGSSGQVPRYGPLDRQCTVTLGAPGGSDVLFVAANVTLHLNAQVVPAGQTLFLPQELRSTARRMYLNGATDWAVSGAATGAYAVEARIVAAPGAWAFTRYKLGSVSTGFTEFDVTALRAVPIGTALTFFHDALDVETMTYASGASDQEFTYVTTVDVAAGDLLTFRVGYDAANTVGVAQVQVRRPHQSLGPWVDPATGNIVSNTVQGITVNTAFTANAAAENWTGIYMTTVNSTLAPSLPITVACTLRHTGTLPAPTIATRAMPLSSTAQWPAQGVLMPFVRRKWSAAVLEELFNADPKAGVTPLQITR